MIHTDLIPLPSPVMKPHTRIHYPAQVLFSLSLPSNTNLEEEEEKAKIMTPLAPDRHFANNKSIKHAVRQNPNSQMTPGYYLLCTPPADQISYDRNSWILSDPPTSVADTARYASLCLLNSSHPSVLSS